MVKYIYYLYEFCKSGLQTVQVFLFSVAKQCWSEWDYLKLVCSKMPPFITDDFHKLPQNIALPETKVHQLEVNVEVQGLCGNDTTVS